ncbi:MAG: PEP-CTERM sorting domain-containing protein [Phycisphaerae bacterium]|jgi:hypothetical protein
MVRSTFFAVSLALLLLATSVHAGPISVRIDDHDFTFDVALDAVYAYDGGSPDHLSVHKTNGHYAGQYTYTGVLPTVPAGALGAPPAPSADPYPLYSGSPVQFAANLDLDMYFVANDGPYTNPAGDSFAVSLNGTQGHLTITGRVATQGFPAGWLYPTANVNGDITLLDIEFSRVTLLARAGSSTADLVEGIGQVKTLLGVDVSDNPELNSGGTFFKFIAPVGTNLFASAAAPYDPLVSTLFSEISGRASGEAGLIPEPATLFLLAMGGLAMLRRRRE